MSFSKQHINIIDKNNRTFMDATPAKWNVLRVIWVVGSDKDCDPTAPIASPGWIIDRLYLVTARCRMASTWVLVSLAVLSHSNVLSSENSLLPTTLVFFVQAAFALPCKVRVLFSRSISARSID
jgi:hypothetical protein